jgi:hypothetical protein
MRKITLPKTVKSSGQNSSATDAIGWLKIQENLHATTLILKVL